MEAELGVTLEVCVMLALRVALGVTLDVCVRLAVTDGVNEPLWLGVGDKVGVCVGSNTVPSSCRICTSGVSMKPPQ